MVGYRYRHYCNQQSKTTKSMGIPNVLKCILQMSMLRIVSKPFACINILIMNKQYRTKPKGN